MVEVSMQVKGLPAGTELEYAIAFVDEEYLDLVGVVSGSDLTEQGANLGSRTKFHAEVSQQELQLRPNLLFLYRVVDASTREVSYAWWKRRPVSAQAVPNLPKDSNGAKNDGVPPKNSTGNENDGSEAESDRETAE